jgi:hypothetical protein
LRWLVHFWYFHWYIIAKSTRNCAHAGYYRCLLGQ